MVAPDRLTVIVASPNSGWLPQSTTAHFGNTSPTAGTAITAFLPANIPPITSSLTTSNSLPFITGPPVATGNPGLISISTYTASPGMAMSMSIITITDSPKATTEDAFQTSTTAGPRSTTISKAQSSAMQSTFLTETTKSQPASPPSSPPVSVSAVLDTDYHLMLKHLPTNAPKFVASVECERAQDPGGSSTHPMEMKCSAKVGGVARRKLAGEALGLMLLMGVVVIA